MTDLHTQPIAAGQLSVLTQIPLSLHYLLSLIRLLLLVVGEEFSLVLEAYLLQGGLYDNGKSRHKGTDHHRT